MLDGRQSRPRKNLNESFPGLTGTTTSRSSHSACQNPDNWVRTRGLGAENGRGRRESSRRGRRHLSDSRPGATRPPPPTKRNRRRSATSTRCRRDELCLRPANTRGSSHPTRLGSDRRRQGLWRRFLRRRAGGSGSRHPSPHRLGKYSPWSHPPWRTGAAPKPETAKSSPPRRSNLFGNPWSYGKCPPPTPQPPTRSERRPADDGFSLGSAPPESRRRRLPIARFRTPRAPRRSPGGTGSTTTTTFSYRNRLSPPPNRRRLRRRGPPLAGRPFVGTRANSTARQSYCLSCASRGSINCVGAVCPSHFRV